MSRVTGPQFISLALLCAAVGLAAELRGTEGTNALATRIAEATQAIADAPRDANLYARRAALYAASGQHARAIADYDRVLKLDPQAAAAYDQRGSQQFMLGRVAESIADFDRFLELRPDQETWHWKRGISYYYAGQWDKGRRQFAGYQTVDDNDVENAVWHFLCTAGEQGIDAARNQLLKIKDDTRVPMMTVYELYAGRAQPDDVLAVAVAGSPTEQQKNTRLFYAHLYLGLYSEATGERASAAKHIATAAEHHKIDHYMWNVADVHARLLREPAASP